MVFKNQFVWITYSKIKNSGRRILFIKPSNKTEINKKLFFKPLSVISQKLINKGF